MGLSYSPGPWGTVGCDALASPPLCVTRRGGGFEVPRPTGAVFPGTLLHTAFFRALPILPSAATPTQQARVRNSGLWWLNQMRGPKLHAWSFTFSLQSPFFGIFHQEHPVQGVQRPSGAGSAAFLQHLPAGKVRRQLLITPLPSLNESGRRGITLKTLTPQGREFFAAETPGVGSSWKFKPNLKPRSSKSLFLHACAFSRQKSNGR